MAKDKTTPAPFRRGGPWEDLLRTFDRAVGSPAQGFTAQAVARLVGFWVLWHISGGESGLRDIGWPRNTIWRNRKDFQRVFGVEVQDYLPEMQPDIEAWRDRPVERPKRG